MSNNFTDLLWLQGQPLFTKMLSHPFNRELTLGTLPLEAFTHYLQQDEHYIREYTEALTLLAERVNEKQLKQDLESYAKEGLELEQSMHQTFFSLYQIQPASRKTLACDLYNSFLVTHARSAPIAVTLTALLPCFWFYWKVGQAILAESVVNNPYQLWIETYSGETFRRQVETLLNHVNKKATQTSFIEHKAMRDAFITSSLLELAFWDSAYNSYPAERFYPEVTNTSKKL